MKALIPVPIAGPVKTYCDSCKPARLLSRQEQDVCIKAGHELRNEQEQIIIEVRPFGMNNLAEMSEVLGMGHDIRALFADIETTEELEAAQLQTGIKVLEAAATNLHRFYDWVIPRAVVSHTILPSGANVSQKQRDAGIFSVDDFTEQEQAAIVAASWSGMGAARRMAEVVSSFRPGGQQAPNDVAAGPAESDAVETSA